MSGELVRYIGPMASLAGVIGYRMPDGRVMLRGEPRTVDAGHVSAPVYWTRTANDPWDGPFGTWDAARDSLAAWCRMPLDCEASAEGWSGYWDDTRLQVMPGGRISPPC